MYWLVGVRGVTLLGVRDGCEECSAHVTKPLGDTISISILVDASSANIEEASNCHWTQDLPEDGQTLRSRPITRGE
jgi:hypothetical protein